RPVRQRLGSAWGDECLARLEARDLGLEQVELGRFDVGRVRDDEVERALEAREELALDELDPVADPSSRAILLGDGERGRGALGRDNACARMLVRDRERDR